MSRPADSPAEPATSRLLLAIAFLGFVSLGLPDAVIGVAWPAVRETFELQQSSLGLVFLGSGCGYFLSSFLAGRLLQAIGIGCLLAASSALVAASGLGFATAPLWPLFVACALLHGLGSGAIDAGLNGFAAQRLSARHMIWLHACYCFGAMLGPLVMTWAVTRGGTWRAGYATIGVTMLILALLFAATRRRWGRPPPPASEGTAAATGTLSSLALPSVWLQMIVFFFYTGLEVAVGQWSYSVLTELRGVDTRSAGACVSAYWASIGVGRVLLGFVAERIGLDRLLRLSMATALVGAMIFALATRGPLSLVGLVLIGLALAPIYPCLMTRTPQRIGAAHAVHAVGFQVGMAMLGAAILPGLVGLIVQRQGLATVGYAAVALSAAILLLHEVLVRSTPRSPV